MSSRPILQALWLADNIEEDQTTGKITLSDLFDQIEVETPGANFDTPSYLFFAVRGIRSRVVFTLCYIDLADEDLLMSIQFGVEGTDPLQTHVRAVSVPRMPVPHAGSFVWELQWNDVAIGTCRVEAIITGDN